MKTAKPQSSTKIPRLILFLVLLVILVCLFWKSFRPEYVIFSNDGSLAIQESQWIHLPESFIGSWYDLNTLGCSGGSVVPDFTQVFRWIFGAVGYAKFLAPVCLWFFGAAAYFFFRRAGMSAIAAVLGGIGACLTTAYFSNVCWGSIPPTIAFGMDLLALGALIKRDNLPVWVAPALAGFAVGVNVIEAADIGALLSLVVAAFSMYQAVAENGAPFAARVVRGVWRTALVSIFAGFIAAYAVSNLVGANITGIAGTKQDAQSKMEHYDSATPWSLPKKETLALVIPNLFGCNVITPGPSAYWGNIGTDPSWDRYFASDEKGPLPVSFIRHTGRGVYIGAFIVFIACWAGVQSLRKKTSAFTDLERRYIWFWWGLAFVSLFLAWGRYAPFYKIPYLLVPYFSTIRNPDKFLHVVTLAMIILFGYGIHGLSRLYLDVPFVAAPKGRFKVWWANATHFERRWVVASIGLVILSIVGWGVYAATRGQVADHLTEWQRIDYLRSGKALDAKELNSVRDGVMDQLTFSLQQVGWFVLIIAASVGMLLAIMTGAFAGRRANWAGVLLGIILIGDLVRADLPFINWWEYKSKYEVGNPEPVIKFLADKPYEHRVAYTPPPPYSSALPEQFSWFEKLYTLEWMQQLFPVYSIPTLDIVQMPRMPQDLLTFNDTLRMQPNSDQRTLDESTAFRIGRRWQLSATRYLVGPVPALELMNQKLDSVPNRNRFRIVQKFDLRARPGVEGDRISVSELQATPSDSPNAQYALFEDTAALPRATLFSNWEIVTNQEAALARLVDPAFDPASAIVLTKPLPAQPSGTNQDLTAVKFTSYKPATIKLEATPTKPSVLMLADAFDPDWQVFVDGKKSEILRCNYVMRGVYLEPGRHDVEFRFRPHISLFYENMIAIFVACGLLCYATMTIRQRRAAEPGTN